MWEDLFEELSILQLQDGNYWYGLATIVHLCCPGVYHDLTNISSIKTSMI